MTLTKAIEAARDSYGLCIKRLEDFKHEFGGDLTTMAMIPHAKNCLAALPDKPMSEEEIFRVVSAAWARDGLSKISDLSEDDVVRYTIAALRDAGVLYVAESGE